MFGEVLFPRGLWDSDTYSENGNFDSYINGNASLVLPDTIYSRVSYKEEIIDLLSEFLNSYGLRNLSAYNFLDFMIVICTFCKYVSYDSVLESWYFIKDFKSLHNSLQRAFQSEFFTAHRFSEDGIAVKYVYSLSSRGIDRALELIPDSLFPFSLKSKRVRKKNPSFIAHDYYCGINFFHLLSTGFLFGYKREVVNYVNGVSGSSHFIAQKEWGYQENNNIFTDVVAYFNGDIDCSNSVFFIEEDTGFEDAETVLSKMGDYYFASYIGYASSHVLLYSFRSKINNYLDTYFPFLFNKSCVLNVCSLMSHFDYDLFTLLIHLCDCDQLLPFAELNKRRSFLYDSDFELFYESSSDRIGDIELSDFVKICNYSGEKAYDAFYNTSICALAIFRLFTMAGIERVIMFNFSRLKYMTSSFYAEKMKSVRSSLYNCQIDLEMVRDFSNCCCYYMCANPYYIFLKEQYNYAECRKRRNRLICHLMSPFNSNSKNPAIKNYHFAMICGSEAVFIPTNLISGYRYTLFPQHTHFFKYMKVILENYYPGVKYIGECGESFMTGEKYPTMYLRNCYQYSFVDKSGVLGNKGAAYSGEVYVEHTCASLAALFRVRFFLERYCGLDTGNRHVTIVCLVDSFNDAVNTALFLDYWKHVPSSLHSSPDIHTHSVEVCFCLYADIMEYNLDKKFLFHVAIDKDAEEGLISKSDLKALFSGSDNKASGSSQHVPDKGSANGKKSSNRSYDASYSQTLNGFGYGSKFGIYHSRLDFSCHEFYQNPVAVPAFVDKDYVTNGFRNT